MWLALSRSQIINFTALRREADCLKKISRTLTIKERLHILRVVIYRLTETVICSKDLIVGVQEQTDNRRCVDHVPHYNGQRHPRLSRASGESWGWADTCQESDRTDLKLSVSARGAESITASWESELISTWTASTANWGTTQRAGRTAPLGPQWDWGIIRCYRRNG